MCKSMDGIIMIALTKRTSTLGGIYLTMLSTSGGAPCVYTTIEIWTKRALQLTYHLHCKISKEYNDFTAIELIKLTCSNRPKKRIQSTNEILVFQLYLRFRDCTVLKFLAGHYSCKIRLTKSRRRSSFCLAAF